MCWIYTNDRCFLKGKWCVYPTPDGWRIAKKRHKELPQFTELSGMVFESRMKAQERVEEMEVRGA